MNKYKIDTFEQFLESKFDDLREIGGMPITKDNCEDLASTWFENLDVQELIDYGEEYGKYVTYETASNLGDMITTETLRLHDELKK
jgi:hypothetical protein